ncbi:MAG TPA: hypothetical protein VGZ47_20510 [Gemmataceae bacterium]|jgi:hypothetical protein|nr:hypothetical protein [Gemmataceae bacterium]
MLDFLKYRIEIESSGTSGGQGKISRPETGEQVGASDEPPVGRWSRFLPQSFRQRQVEVREFPEPALVFRIVWPARLLNAATRVYDALDERMGYFSRTPHTPGDRFEIYLSRMVRLASVSGSCFDSEFSFVTGKGQHLARASRPQPADGAWLVIMDDCLDHDPIIKMLLLAAVLVLALDNREW